MAVRRNYKLSEVYREIDYLDGKFRSKIVRTALRKTNKILLNQIKANAPVITGELKRSVKIVTGKRKKGTSASYVRVLKFYGRMVENGTSKTRPHPFVQPAVEAKLDQMETTFINEIVAGIVSA